MTDEVIVVLGAAVWPDARPSGAMRRRLDGAITAANSNPETWIMVTGGVGQHPPAEAELMRDLLIEAGIAADRILVEAASTTTLGSIVNTVALLRQQFSGEVRLQVCTDTYHQPRCIWLYRLMGIEAGRCAVRSGETSTGSWRWRYYQLREALAFPWTTVLLVLHRWFGLPVHGTGR